MDLDQKITFLTQQLRKDEAFLQEHEEEFTDEVVKLLRRWWWDTAAGFVQRYPEQTRRHGQAGIADLKAQVGALRTRVKEVTEQVFDDPSVWWHKKPRAERDLSERYENRSERVGPKKLDTGLRIAMGAIAPILRDFGYIEPGRYTQWLEWDEAGETHPPGARPCYPYTIDWPPALIETARFYGARLQLAANRLRDIEVLQQQKAERAIERIWDES